MVNAVSPQRQTIQIYVSGCVTQYNKTGLQPVSRPVEQVHYLDRQTDRQTGLAESLLSLEVIL